MKIYTKPAISILICLAVIAFAACKNGPESSNNENDGAGLNVSESAAEFSGVINRDWHLTSLRLDSGIIEINQAALAEFFSDFFTLRFDTQRTFGVAAPNRYFGPYSLADNQAISIGPMANTLMASIFEPEELKEHEYLALLQNAYKWNLTGENLELFSRAEGGAETVLVFIPVTGE